MVSNTFFALNARTIWTNWSDFHEIKDDETKFRKKDKISSIIVLLFWKRKKCNWDFYNILLPLWREILTIWRNLWWLHPPCLALYQGCRKRGAGGDHAPRSDQLTPSQPKGANYAFQLLYNPQIFRPSDIPALYHCCTAYYYREQPLYSLRYEHSMGAWQMFRHIFRTISTLRLSLEFFNALLFKIKLRFGHLTQELHCR